MNYKATAFILSTLIAFTGCSDSNTEKTQVTEVHETSKTKPLKIVEVKIQEEVIVKKDYTLEEIYNSMCIECHSSDGSGNTEKLTPSMIGQSEIEMRNSLIAIEKDEGHIIMEHNRGEILKKGMAYSADTMASYMYQRYTK